MEKLDECGAVNRPDVTPKSAPAVGRYRAKHVEARAPRGALNLRSFALWSPAIVTTLCRADPRLINEHELLRVERRLLALKRVTAGDYFWSISCCWSKSPFFRVIPMRLSTLDMVCGETLRPEDS